ncbi:hypothetical protein [Streptococcus mutans]|uniref:hypothetical protein n=1 Tax=Streptococcus mutans TaxID=1309 RepID=UPI00035FBFB0|nr:hypothetical protein [Streptococcus mutans]MCB4953703.1 hypothetical protein [Streptococcus mutans]MCB5055182.1 hypothetical protein [Streptococcus mutans]UVT92727.1 hypothetical protein NPS18_02240 [Streptococcus mutans]
MVLTVILTAFTLVILVRSGDLPYHIGVLIGRFILPAFSILGLFERKIIMICDTLKDCYQLTFRVFFVVRKDNFVF